MNDWNKTILKTIGKYNKRFEIKNTVFENVFISSLIYT